VPYSHVQPFEARGLVYAIAEHREIHAISRSHIAHDCIAQMNAETDCERRRRTKLMTRILDRRHWISDRPALADAEELCAQNHR